MQKLKSIGYYTESLNNGTEYGVREDGAVFVREKYYNKRYHHYSATKWHREPMWDKVFAGTPESVPVGFASRGNHYLVTTNRLRLPQE